MRHGYPLGWCGRRSRWLLLFAVATFATFYLAGRTSNYPVPLVHVPVYREVRGEIEGEDTPRDPRQVCYQTAGNEANADYDLHDLYGSIVGKVQQIPPSKRVHTKGKLEVFILPFTHVDPGWLKTFDEYTEDTNKILDNMHSFMTQNEAMRFMWAEFVFFERWWSKQNATVRDDVRQLVHSGRLELASGSWVMTDEANAYFPVSVDNIVEGHRYLSENFGEDFNPRVVWSNDPFGYSNSVPYLFQQVGVNRTVINRIHHSLKKSLQSVRAIPFRWKQYFDTNSEVLTQVLPYSHYDILNSCGPQPGDCCQFDFKRMTHWSCPGPKPTPITKENVAEKATLLVRNLKQMAEMYESNVLLMMHGDDFRFDMIEEWHQHHDNFLPLFEEINKGDDVNIRFGTFTDYFNALEKWYKKNKKQPPSVTGDFFPYMCALGDYWTGYFTTRPFYKKQGRQTHHYIRAADLLSAEAFARTGTIDREAITKKLTEARRALSLFQHHDAITGTSKNPVMDNYSRILHNATSLAIEVIETSAKLLTGQKMHVVEYPPTYTGVVQDEPITITPGNPMTVSVYNSLPYKRYEIVSFVVNTPEVVVSEAGEVLAAQIEPSIKDAVVDKDNYRLSFRATLRPLSMSAFTISYDKERWHNELAVIETTPELVDEVQKIMPRIFQVTAAKELTLSLKRISTSHDPKRGLLNAVNTTTFGEMPLSLSFAQYNSQSGGAYILRANAPTLYEAKDLRRFHVKGPLVQSAHVMMPLIYHAITIKDLPGDLGEQVYVTVRADLTNQRNVEMVMRVGMETDNDTLTTFYADSVGLQMLRRESYNSLSTAANYYPMPSAAFVEDRVKRLSVVSNVEHGIRFLEPGGMEIMIDRMLNQDDGKGLGSMPDGIPTDLRPVEMSFTLGFDAKTITNTLKKVVIKHHAFNSLSANLALQSILYPPIVFSSTALDGVVELDNALVPFPCEFQLLTVRPISPEERLLILFRNGADCSLTTSVMCSEESLLDAVTAYLNHLGVKSVRQTTFTGLQQIGEEITNLQKLNPSVDPQKFLAYVFKV